MLRLPNQETPSRILRRIKEAENDSDMPSLPSMASIDGSDEDNEASNDNDDSAADKPARYAVSDVTVASAASTSAGRRGLGKMGKAHQNIARSSYHGNNNNNSSGSAPRNILSPLKLNGRSSPSTANSPSGAVQTDLKGKGKAPFYRDTKSSSPGPLSAVSSNRTVRPATHSPHALRAGSITPSVHVANRMNKPSRRTQAMSFDSSLPETDHLSAHEQPNDATEQDEATQSLNLDFTEDSGFPARPQLETSIWSRQSEGNSSHHPSPLRRTEVSRNTSPESVNLSEEDDTEHVVSPPLRASPERPHNDTYDHTTASPTAQNGQFREEASSERRGSTSSSASGSASEIPQIQVTPAPAPMARARRVLIRSTSFDRAEDSIGTTPGMGRRLPSAEKRNDNSASYIIDPKLIEGDTEKANDLTPSKSNHDTPPSSAPLTGSSTALTFRGYSYSATPEALATPKPSTSDADLERRKMHLLSTLRMTALKSNKKVRLARGTPHPRDRRARSVTPSALHEDDSTNGIDASAASGALAEDLTAMSGSSSLSNGSSNDLTTNPRGHGNTSLPLAGAGTVADGGIVGTSRFNNAKLNNYLHTLNTHLTTENQNLIKTLEETAKEVSRLMRKNEELSRLNTTGDLSVGANVKLMPKIAEEGDDESNATHEILRSHRKTSQDISSLRQRLTGSTPSESTSRLQEELRAKDTRLERLEAESRLKDEEIAVLRRDMLTKSASGDEGESSGADAPAVLQQQIFDLRDELSEVKASSAVQASNLARARAEQVEQASRHNKVIADLQDRADDLVSELEEKEAIIEEIENELVRQEEDFRAKMSNLEEELCKVMEEQEVQLREARKELQSLKKVQGKPNTDVALVQELNDKLTILEKEKEEILAGKAKVEALLQQATSTIARTAAEAKAEGTSGEVAEEVAFLQKRINELEAEASRKDQQLAQLQSELDEAKHQHAAEVNNLRNGADEADSEYAQLERKLASQNVLLKETEKAFADSEDNLKQTMEDLEDARQQLQRVLDEVKQLKDEHNELLNSDLQKKYDAAVREIGNLKHQLAYPAPSTQYAPADKYSRHDSRDIEIRTLRSSNHELETRVNQLRKQALLAGQAPGNRNSPSLATPGRSEKSVRFDSVRSMKTPRTASQLLGGMSWLDKTGNSSAANATAAPLYAEIDNLNRDIRQYKHLLQTANEEIDDKLRKLDGAGNNVVSMAKELELAKRRIRELERGSTSAPAESAVVRELRAVRDEVTNERSALMKRLKDIQEQCRQMAQQLDASRSAQLDSQRRLDWQTAQLQRIQGRTALDSADDPRLCMDPSHFELAAERDAIFAGVASLKRDLSKVQQDALELGQDLQIARRGGALPPPMVTDLSGTSGCTKTSCLTLQTRSKQEAKGLLLMISHLKAKYTRESYYRADLAHQKLYLSLLIEQKQKNLDAMTITLSRFGLPPPQEPPKPRMSLRIAVHAVIAVLRMEALSKEWRKQSAVKSALRDAYRQTRGKPFVPVRDFA